jgi:cell division septation protein DedD
MNAAGQGRCPRCGATVEPSQEYCLECGGRLRQPDGAAARASTTVSGRHDWAGAWVVPALLGLVIAVLGTGAAIAISGDGEEESAISTATGGSLTVTGGTPTLTAPEPTTAATETTGPATTAPTTTAPPPPPANPAAITWPRDRRGWTIVLLSLPQTNGRDAAAAQAKKARDGGLRRVGVLDSSRYASLHPVFQGVFADEAEASSALQRARTVFPSAYQREIVP